jgi:hypothetical protein
MSRHPYGRYISRYDSLMTTPPGREQESVPQLLAVYGVFVVLVCLYTWPLVLDLGGHLRHYYDADNFVAVEGWIARRLVTAPRALFDTNVFYPYGSTLAYADPMLVSAVIFAPVYAISRNPILAYNVTILLLQALAGWAAYLAARRLTGSALAGWVAGIVFALSPFRTGHYNLAHVQLSFPTPLAFLAFARFLEQQRVRYLAAALFFLWCQMVTILYFGIPLSLMLAALAIGFVLLRPWAWRGRTLVALGIGGLAFVLAFLPIVWPYVSARSEMGFERSLADTQGEGWTADILWYLAAGPESRFYHMVNTGEQPGLFPGFTVYALVLLAFVLAPRAAGPDLPQSGIWLRRLVATGLGITLAAVTLFVATGGGTVRIGGVRLQMIGLTRGIVALFVLGAAWLALEGWAWARSGGERALSPREWAPLLALLALVFVLLTLGPAMRLGGHPVGIGLYAWVYRVFVPMRALRITAKIAFAAMFLLGLLAAFGLAALQTRLAGTRLARALVLVPFLLLVEYLPRPLRFDVIRWSEPPPVYRWLAAQPGDFPIFEWPSVHEFPDATYGMWTLLHGKRLVNGSSGFDPPFTDAIRDAASRLPDPEAVTLIRSVYPLRYVLAHLGRLATEERAQWEAFSRTPPAGLRFVGRFGDSLVFEPEPGPERSRRLERTFSTAVVSAHHEARVRIGLTRADPEVEPIVDVSFDGRAVTRLTPRPAPEDLRFPLRPPYPVVDRNVFRAELTYRLRPDVQADPRYRIGATGLQSPADIVVVSAGKEHGNEASIRVDGLEFSANRRGYNVVVVDQWSGRVLAHDLFDTFIARTESARLAEFIRRVPAGAIVVAASKNDGVGQLADDAVQTFRSMGGGADPRAAGLFVSHLLIGVKGAPPGSAIEALGFRRLTWVVGEDRPDPQMVVEDFRLE